MTIMIDPMIVIYAVAYHTINNTPTLPEGMRYSIESAPLSEEANNVLMDIIKDAIDSCPNTISIDDLPDEESSEEDA